MVIDLFLFVFDLIVKTTKPPNTLLLNQCTAITLFAFRVICLLLLYDSRLDIYDALDHDEEITPFNVHILKVVMIITSTYYYK